MFFWLAAVEVPATLAISPPQAYHKQWDNTLSCTYKWTTRMQRNGIVKFLGQALPSIQGYMRVEHCMTEETKYRHHLGG